MGAWLGLHRKADMKFYWADGTPLAGYTAWAPSEPNHQSEKCGNMIALGANKGKWNDWECSQDKAELARAPVILCQI